MTEVGCLAHARRKFNDLWVNHKSPLAEEALQLFGKLYDVEREARELSAGERQRIRQRQSQPIADKLREWLLLQRQKATDGTAIAKAIDYSLGRWKALTRFLDDGALPIDNNWVENRIRPIALGRSNWLFAGSLRAGKRAAAVMSLIQSARLNGHDPYRYLKDVLERLPTQPREPHRRIAAAQLDAGNDPELTTAHQGKMSCPDAYKNQAAGYVGCVTQVETALRICRETWARPPARFRAMPAGL